MVNLILFGLKFLFLFLFYLFLLSLARGILRDTVVREELPQEAQEASLQLLSPQGNIVKEISFFKQAVLGRSDKADLKIDDDFASYTHAKVLREGENFFLKDLKSTNGTYLNSAKVTKARLNEGDIIAIGKTKIKFIR